MSTENVKKAILYNWMYRIFVTKEFDRSEFKDRRAIEILNMANFNIPFNKAIKPFLDATTNEFKEAMKNKSVLQLLAAYPLPKFIGIEEEEEIPELEDSFKELSVESNVEAVPMNVEEHVAKEPTVGELQASIEKIIENGDLETLTNKMIIKNLEEIYGVDLSHRKKEIKQIVEKVINGPEEAQPIIEEEDIIMPVHNPIKEKKSKKSEKEKKAPLAKLGAVKNSGKQAPREVDPNAGRRGELRDRYWKINDRIGTLRAFIARDSDYLYDMHGNADQKLQAQIDANKQEINKLKKEIYKVEDELYSIPIPSRWDGKFGTQPDLFERIEEEEKPKNKSNAMQKLFATLKKPTIEGDMPDEIKVNLRYVAFLSYYAISPLIAVEDPTLEVTYKLYPDLESSFKMNFANLPIKQRYEFIKSIFNGRSFKQVNELIEKGEPLNPSENGNERSIAVSLSNFKHSTPNVDDEIDYNLMYYVEPNKEFSKDVMIANIVNEIKRRTKTSDEDVKSKVEKELGVAADRTSILEKVHTRQLSNIKDFIHKHYSSLTSQSDEEMRNIQVHYEEVRPPLRFDKMEEYEGALPQTPLIYSVSGSSEYRSDLLNIAKAMKNSAYETEIYRIKKEIESNDRIIDLDKKSERKEAELKYINKQIEKGELSQVAGKALSTFVSYYDSVSKLPTTMYEKNRMFEYKRIEDLPEQFRPAAEKELRRRLAQMLTSHNTHLTEQKDALTKIQIEINAPKIDIISVADKINKLQASEEVKNKLLTKVQKEGKINIFMTFKQLSNKMRINPLVYHGFNRSKRIQKTTQEMSELDKIKAAFPKSNHTISYCFTQLYLKPWLNLPNTFDYFISHPMDLEKEDMSERERFLYGQKINRKIEGHDNLYRPTTIFWRVYCTDFMIYRNDKYTCNMDKIQSDLINPQTRQYVLGIYNTSTTDEFRVLTEEDYQKECDWFNNSDMGSLTTFDNISAIDLSKNVKLSRFARDRMKNQIKAVLALIYNAHDISLSSENRIELNSKKIENELYDGATVQGKTIFYKYVYDVLNFLYLINPSSPLYPFTTFFQRLLLTSSKNNYATLVKMSKNMSEVFPEIYLIDNKQEFLEIVESKLREDTVNAIKNIRVTVEPGFKFNTNSSSMSINYNEKINNKLASFDHSKFKNLCVNYDQVKDPFFVTELENQLICVGKDEFHAILRDDVGITLTIPQEVIDRVKTLAKTDKSDELKRIFTMQYVADDFASSHFNVLNILKELVDEDHISNKEDLEELIDGSEEVQKAIKMVETELESKLSEQETELFVNHLMSQGYNYFIQSIKKYIDTTEFSDELKEKLVNEYKKRYNIYYDEKLMRNDRTERISILKDIINTLSNKYGDSISDDVKEIIVDYFHTRHILPLVKDVKRDSHDHSIGLSNPFYTPQCSVCSKFSNKNDAVKTYLFKDGKKVLAEFCSTKCMERVSEKEFEIPKDVKEMTLHGLVDKIVTPMALTYEELIHRTKLIGMSLPEGISFNEAYVSWLSNSSFSDSIWLNFHHETLDKIAKHYNVKEDDVKYLWKDLIAKSDFYSLFHSKLEEIAKPYSKYMFNVASQEIYSPECKYPKIQVENWIESAAQHLLPQDWINHSFNTFDFDANIFKPFFQTFRGCGDIVNSVKERKFAKSNRQFVMDIVMYLGNYNVREEDRNALRNKIEKNVQKMNIENKDNIIEYSRNLLIDKLQIKLSAQPLENVIYKRMNDKYGDFAPLTILAADFKLDINDSNTSVEFYRDLLLKIGLEFINKYINMMNAVKESVDGVKKGKRKGRKLPSGYKAILDAENTLLALKEKSAELTNKDLALRKSIEEKKKEIEKSIEYESTGRWAPEVLEEELKELQKAYSDIQGEQIELEFEIEDAENAVKASQDKYVVKGKKQALPSVQKKGVFRKVKEAAKEEKVEKSEMNPVERRIQIENTLKYNLFNAISARLPETFNLYNVAEILGLNEKGSIFANDTVLTTKMIKEGKKELNVGDVELIDEVLDMEDEEFKLGEDEVEAVDQENLEVYAEDNDADEGDDLGEKEGEYGEEPEGDDYSY